MRRKRWRWSIRREGLDQAGTVEAESSIEALERVAWSEGIHDAGREQTWTLWQTWRTGAVASGTVNETEAVTIVVVVSS